MDFCGRSGQYAGPIPICAVLCSVYGIRSLLHGIPGSGRSHFPVSRVFSLHRAAVIGARRSVESEKELTYLCIAASDSHSQNLIQHFKKCIQFIHDCRLRGGGCLVHCLAGVSRSTTIIVAYLMTVTNLGWEECLSAVKAVRPFVGPNLGFQRQLQEFEKSLAREYRVWLRQEYGRNPFNDQEKLERLHAQHDEKEKVKNAQNHWLNHTGVSYSLPYKAYGSTSTRWTDT